MHCFALPSCVPHSPCPLTPITPAILSWRSVPIGDELRSDWECFTPSEDADRRHCVRLPALTPEVHRPGDPALGALDERFSLSMMPPDTMCAQDWRYMQAIGCFQRADYDGTDTLIYNGEYDDLFESLARIGIGSDGDGGTQLTKQQLDLNNDLRTSFTEYRSYLTNIGCFPSSCQN